MVGKLANCFPPEHSNLSHRAFWHFFMQAGTVCSLDIQDGWSLFSLDLQACLHPGWDFCLQTWCAAMPSDLPHRNWEGSHQCGYGSFPLVLRLLPCPYLNWLWRGLQAVLLISRLSSNGKVQNFSRMSPEWNPAVLFTQYIPSYQSSSLRPSLRHDRRETVFIFLIFGTCLMS